MDTGGCWDKGIRVSWLELKNRQGYVATVLLGLRRATLGIRSSIAY